MHSYCTYFDSNFIDRGLCLWSSLSEHSPGAKLYVCCLDDKVFDVLTSLQIAGVTPVRLSDVEALYPDLAGAKANRSHFEYYFTITPSWIKYLFDTKHDLDEITYLDGDLYFFSNPEPLFDDLNRRGGEVSIIAHRFTDALQDREAYGTYNVGWLTFKRVPNALQCLADWQRQCIEWCYDYVDGDRFADQKYLNAWPSTYQGVVVLDHPGANVALWNLRAGTIAKQGNHLLVDGQPLIFYHFHALSQISEATFFTNFTSYHAPFDRIVRSDIYAPYIAALKAAQRRLETINIRPLIRYKHSFRDIRYALLHPFSGLFMFHVADRVIP